MKTLQNAAHVYSGLKNSREDDDEQYYNSQGCQKYDAFIAGAMAPETDAFYKAKYSVIAGDEDWVEIKETHLEEARQKVIYSIISGSLLGAIKIWKEANPGMSLKQAKEYIDLLRPQYTKGYK